MKYGVWNRAIAESSSVCAISLSDDSSADGVDVIGCRRRKLVNGQFELSAAASLLNTRVRMDRFLECLAQQVLVNRHSSSRHSRAAENTAFHTRPETCLG